MAGTKSVAEQNREYWNSKTTFYDKEKEWADAVAAQFTKELHNRREWLGLPEGKSGNVRLLDVACGPGMLSHALFDFVDEARGIDIADRMIDVYNDRAKAQGLYPATMSAFQGNIVAADGLEQANISGPEFFEFDIVGLANALHHMEDPALAIRKLLQRLKPRGTLLLIDYVADTEGSGKLDEATTKHTGAGHRSGNNSGKNPYGIVRHGFTRDEMQELLQGAGCIDIGIVCPTDPIKFPPSLGSIERTAFIAKATKN